MNYTVGSSLVKLLLVDIFKFERWLNTEQSLRLMFRDPGGNFAVKIANQKNLLD